MPMYWTTDSPVLHRGKWALWIRDKDGDSFRVYGRTIKEADRKTRWLLRQLSSEEPLEEGKE